MSKINGIGVGVPYGTYKGTGYITDSSTFYAPLESSLILSKGTGNPTWSRATAAWRFDENNYLRSVPSGCAVFGGARLVRNLVTYSEDVSNAAWTKSNCTTPTATSVVCSNSTTLQRVYSGASSSFATGSKLLLKCRLTYVDHPFVQINCSGNISNDYANFDIQNGTFSVGGTATATMTLVSAGVYDCAVQLNVTNSIAGFLFASIFATSLASTNGATFTGDGVKSYGITRIQSHDVTGYASTYVPEYVSGGVVATPFFGAGIDGAKYFTTDQYGAPLSGSSLLGFRRETAATNNLLFGRDLAGSSYAELGNNPTKYAWVPSTKGSTLVTNGTFDSDVSGWTKSGVGTFTFVSGAGRIDGTSASTSANQTITCVVGTTYLITGNYSAVSGSGNIEIGIYTSADAIIKYQPIITGGSGTFALIFTATETSHILKITARTGIIVDFDNIVVKECSCSPVRNATGLDGIANTATTLTAAATDAAILQSITLASAARCASAYVRRKTGTGIISFTQDGGSTWTDITSLINTSTFTRVEITSTLTNPSVGFKISTSGDAIEVDGVQNEAGAVATSLILTTTAAVTRNAESLTYQTTSNIDFSVGTLSGSLKVLTPTGISVLARAGSASGSQRSSGTANTTWANYDGTTVVSKAGLSDITTGMRKRVVSWGPAGLKVTGDGLTPASGTFDGTWGAASNIEVGLGAGCYVGDVAIYNYQMTDAEMMSITT